MLNKEMTDLHTYLRSLAARYETKEFLVGDPSWFMHQVEGDSDKELLAFMAAALSYGSRKQFLPKIDRLLCHARDYSLQTCATLPHDGIIRRWLEDRAYADVVPDDDACFYRLYTNRTMNGFLQAIQEINSNTAHAETFKKRFFLWFDAFKLLKYLNYANEHYYKRMPICTEATKLAQVQNLNFL